MCQLNERSLITFAAISCIPASQLAQNTLFIVNYRVKNAWLKNFADMNKIDKTKKIRNGILLLKCLHLPKPAQQRLKY